MIKLLYNCWVQLPTDNILTHFIYIPCHVLPVPSSAGPALPAHDVDETVGGEGGAGPAGRHPRPAVPGVLHTHLVIVLSN